MSGCVYFMYSTQAWMLACYCTEGSFNLKHFTLLAVIGDQFQ